MLLGDNLKMAMIEASLEMKADGGYPETLEVIREHTLALLDSDYMDPENVHIVELNSLLETH
jgi:hypothetical protein